jgi:hypothetical protein
LDIYDKAAPYNKNMLHVIEGADHTFNRLDWEEEVIDYSIRFFEVNKI